MGGRRAGEMTHETYRDKILPIAVEFIMSSRFETGFDVSFMHDNVPAQSAANVIVNFGEQGINASCGHPISLT